MEKRRIQQARLAFLGSKWRRFLLLFLLCSVLLAAQLITSYSRLGTAAPVESDDGGTRGVLAGVEDVTVNKAFNIKTQQEQQADGTRTRLLETLAQLKTRDLQKAVKLYDSTWNPAAAQKLRMEEALQSLKMTLLEEVSAHGFVELMAAAHHALPLSDTPRPEPLQVVIVTTWRSGSTFMEELLNSHPAVFNQYEPLTFFGLRQIRTGQDSLKAQRVIHELMSCKYEGQDEYLRSAHEVRELLTRNKLVWKVCNSEDWGDALCFNDSFLSQACHLFPWRTMKLVRLRLRFVRPLLQDPELNVRVVYLVRDPRGVINSRTDTVKWCKTADCNDPSLLCSDMDEDLKTAAELHRDFPERFYLLRYEDMSLNPVNKTRELLSHLTLDFDPHMEEFLASHTTKNYDKPWSTSRESKKRVTYWASKLKPDKLNEVQKACGSVMAKFGYLTIDSTKNVTVDKILGPLVLPSAP
ncbi:carbohydrate sulfotransferase 4-like isoform X2 [Portunus trituberculatus]|uniref:carbohydrate sulfotransferase 4-like isoform X2 n=1 Tax=Portunus trituberculatus TaxID=210409 RepID=UPI001E1CB8DA|nr:carbohydrate sulfotransferase 4-like isoform X2 [Portunus trituberculatus]